VASEALAYVPVVRQEVVMVTKTRTIEMDDGLVHLVEVRTPPLNDDNYWTRQWCDNRPIEHANPPFVTTPATCMRCFARPRPVLVRWVADDETK
jgi:hypothetical protein